ncbi:MAG TPA: hypothetical protein PKY05_12115, partial [Fibrobacteria bacterium]|nr:hypothetical protein [Fibrobacteria bacterium]
KANSVTTRKNYWMLEQGFNAGITLANLTGDPLVRERALRMAEGSADFFYKYFYQKNGAAIMSTNASGTGLSTVLGDEWDAGYHASEFSWLVYLYGHLLHHRDSVALFYRLAPSAESQDIRLSPMALPGDSLAILSVEKDGSSFGRFDQVGRTLHLQPGEGGIFRVVFGWRNSRMGSVGAPTSGRAWNAVWDRRARCVRLDLPSAMDLKVRVVDAKGGLRADLGMRIFPSGASTLEVPRSSSGGLRWVLLDANGERRVVPLGL